MILWLIKTFLKRISKKNLTRSYWRLVLIMIARDSDCDCIAKRVKISDSGRYESLSQIVYVLEGLNTGVQEVLDFQKIFRFRICDSFKSHYTIKVLKQCQKLRKRSVVILSRFTSLQQQNYTPCFTK